MTDIQDIYNVYNTDNSGIFLNEYSILPQPCPDDLMRDFGSDMIKTVSHKTHNSNKKIKNDKSEGQIEIIPKKSRNINKRKVKNTKKKRKSNLIPIYQTSITFDRKTLLGMTSNDFEQSVRTLEMEREITKEEWIEIKRQRRLIKNRESASIVRLRKKEYLKSLNDTVERLTSENEELKKNYKLLENKHKILKEDYKKLEKKN
jgi:hypothetical protein